MHILHLVPTGGWAGTEQMVANMANRTVGDDARVTVVVRDGQTASRSMIRSRFDARVQVVFVRKGASPGAQAESVGEHLGGTPDVIHVHLRPGAALARSLELDAPVVAHLHVRYFSAHFWWTDALICVSPWQSRDIPASYAGRVYTVPNWVEPFDLLGADERLRLRRSLDVADRGVVVGAVGRLSEEKAFDVLCRAFSKVASRDDRLIVIGDGPCRDELRQLAKEDQRIALLGYVPDTRRLLSAIDLFASSSRLESFGMSVLEAMAAGLPIVATRARGVQDLLEGTHALLADIDDVNALADALQRGLTEARTNREVVEYPLEKYDPAVCARSLRAVYDRLLGASAPASALVRSGSTDGRDRC